MRKAVAPALRMAAAVPAQACTTFLALLCAAITFLAGGTALAQTLPRDPVADEPFVLYGLVAYQGGTAAFTSSSHCAVTRTEATVAGSEILVTPFITRGDPTDFFALLACPFAVAVPGLPPGRYAAGLRLPPGVDGVDLAQLSASSVTVAPDPGRFEASRRDLDGNWFDPAEPGWGINIVQGESGALFAVWLTYRPETIASRPTQPHWLVMPAGRWISPTTFRGLLYDSEGPGVNREFDASRKRLSAVGAVTLTFLSDREATLDAEFVPLKITLPPVAKRAIVQRLVF